MELGIYLGSLSEESGEMATMRETSSGHWVTHGGSGVTKVWDFGFLDVAPHFPNLLDGFLSSILFPVESHALRATIIPPDAVANEPPVGGVHLYARRLLFWRSVAAVGPLFRESERSCGLRTV